MKHVVTPTTTEGSFPSFAWRALHYAALWAFAGAQPLFDLLSAHADFLIAHRLEGGEILVLTLLILAGPPVLLTVIELVVSAFSRRLGRGVYGFFVGALGCLLVFQSMRLLRAAPTAMMLAATVIIFGVVTWSVLRLAFFRSLLSVLALGVILFPALFLLRAPIASMLRTEQVVGTAKVRAPVSTPIVVVVFDELPLVTLLDAEKRINGHRFPNFGKLAATSNWYRNASTVAQTTTFAVPAILTGRVPDRIQFAIAASYPENLFTWLGGAYRLAVFESLTHLCPDELCRETKIEEAASKKIRAATLDLSAVYLHRVLPHGLATRLPQIDATWRDFWSAGRRGPVHSRPPHEAANSPKPWKGDIRDQVRRFLEQIAAAASDERPALLFLHLNIPHVPWRLLPSGKEYGPRNLTLVPHGVVGETWAGSDWETLQGRQRHLLQTGFADRVLGRVMAALKDVGIWHDSLVVVTADHGVAFRTGGSRRAVDPKQPSAVMQIPLFIKMPAQQRGLVRDDNAETVDILPTIAASLGIEPPWSFDGRSLLDPDVPAPAVKHLAIRQGRDAVERKSFPPVLAGLDESLESMLEAFGSGEDPASVFLIGPAPELVGRPVPAGASEQPSRYRVELVEAGELERVDLAASYLPVHLAGRILEPGESGGTRPVRAGGGALRLAIAVNGTVAATTETHVAAAGDIRFTVMIPEAVLRQGKNSVEVFEIVDSQGGRPKLQALSRKGSVRYRLGRDESGEISHLMASDGRRFEIVPGRLTGEVVHTFHEFRGTARSETTGEVANRVVFFVGDRFVTTSRPVAGTPGRFAFVVPYGLLEPGRTEALRFYGLVDGEATVLPFRNH